LEAPVCQEFEVERGRNESWLHFENRRKITGNWGLFLRIIFFVQNGTEVLCEIGDCFKGLFFANQSRLKNILNKIERRLYFESRRKMLIWEM
jgi:hypothetical protein